MCGILLHGHCFDQPSHVCGNSFCFTRLLQLFEIKKTRAGEISFCVAFDQVFAVTGLTECSESFCALCALSFVAGEAVGMDR